MDEGRKEQQKKQPAQRKNLREGGIDVVFRKVQQTMILRRLCTNCTTTSRQSKAPMIQIDGFFLYTCLKPIETSRGIFQISPANSIL